MPAAIVAGLQSSSKTGFASPRCVSDEALAVQSADLSQTED